MEATAALHHHGKFFHPQMNTILHARETSNGKHVVVVQDGRRPWSDRSVDDPSPSQLTVWSGLLFQARRPRNQAVWGNGRDWSRAPSVEGDWVRVYPTCDSWVGAEEDLGPYGRRHTHVDDSAELVPVGDKEVKVIVAAVQKLSRVVRDVHRRYPRVSDDEHLRLVTDALQEDVILWLPRN